MGRPSHARSLSVWSNGERVGAWTIPARGDSQFLYDRAWRESALGRPLSLSLPYTGDMPLRGAVVRDYFDNLLPDSEPIRKRLASHKKAGVDRCLRFTSGDRAGLRRRRATAQGRRGT